MNQPITIVTKNQVDFEKALQDALERRLQTKGFLKSQFGKKYYVGNPCCKNLYITADDAKKDLIECLVNCDTNHHPCLIGYVTLCLRKESEDHFQEDEYYFHIPGEPHLPGSGSYTVEVKNALLVGEKEIEIHIIRGIEYFIRKGLRLY